MIKLIKNIRLYWLAAFSLLLFWLLFRAIVPFGKITYQTDFKSPSYFIGKLSPSERLLKLGDQSAIIAEPIYFSLFTPRPFSKAKVTVIFSNPPSFLELGVRLDKTIWSYNLKPVYSSLLEDLRLDKSTLVEGENFLWQKNAAYNTISDFKNNLPASNKIIVYNYPLASDYKLADSAWLPEARIIKTNLRGAYQFYTYSQGDPIVFDFSVKDINENADADPIEVNLYQGDKLVTRATLADDVDRSDTERVLRLATDKIPVGVYRLEYKANNDIITTQIKTQQSKLAFSGAVWLAETGQSTVNLYTDSAEINLQTINPRSLQTINFANQPFTLAETYKQYDFSINRFDSKIKIVSLKHGDLKIASNSLLAFSEADFFNPLLRQLPRKASDTNLGTDFILANYQPAKRLANGDWESTLEFDLSGAYREKNKYSFMLSAPQLNGQSSDFIIKQIKVDLAEPDLWQFIVKKLKNYEVK